MKKLIFFAVPMQKIQEKIKSTEGTSEGRYFGLSEILDQFISKEDEVTFIMLGTVGEKINSNENYGKFEKEITEVNQNIHANITFTRIDCSFDVSSEIYFQDLKKIIKHFKNI